jgi:hypothetical protein
MDSVEDYARQWTKREQEDLYTLSEWAKSVRNRIIYEWGMRLRFEIVNIEIMQYVFVVKHF